MGNIILYVIIGLGFLLRLLFIDKTDGLWNDEYVSWMISQKPLFDGFWQSILSQCHMPFYYIYLKFFTKIFGNSDLLLRLTSVFVGVISIYIMYLLGKLKDKKTGLLCAGFCAISSFLIYYSQEVRMYSVLFLFSVLSLFFTIKLTVKTNNKNLIGYIISNFFILFTHTIGFVYVFFNLLYVSYKLFKNYKKQIYILWSTVFISVLTLMPIIIKILTTRSFSQWWSSFTPAKISFIFTDYLSPMIINLTGSPDKFFYDCNLIFVVSCIIPTLICLGLIIKAILKKENFELFLVAFLTLFVMIIASISGKLVLLTKYSIEIYPILILLVCLGLNSISKKWIKITIISIYVLITFGYLIFSPVSAFKIRRSEGHKIITDILSRANLKTNDVILLEYYPQDRFEKYFDFSKYQVLSINKSNFVEYMTPNSDYADIYTNGKLEYQEVFQKGFNKYLKHKMDTEIINKLEPNQSIVIVFLDSVSQFSDETIQKTANSSTEYNKTPLLFLVFSHIKNQTVKNAMIQMPITYFERKGSWSVVKFTKFNKI